MDDELSFLHFLQRQGTIESLRGRDHSYVQIWSNTEEDEGERKEEDEPLDERQGLLF